MAAPSTLESSCFAPASTRGTEHQLPHDDPERMGELLRALEPRLVAVAIRITREREAARDVVQSAFEKALRQAREFRGEARVSTWLHRIVVNEALMWLRSERRHRRRLVELDAGSEATLADPALDAPELLVRHQEASRLHQGMRTLRQDEREVLEHCALGGRSYADLARRTGTHPAALKSRAFRARQHLSLVLRER
jgi:RNA polymerase sigma-70 factor (ECF subfamily)